MTNQQYIKRLLTLDYPVPVDTYLQRVFNPYRPELHYMRGEGPAYRKVHG